MSSGHKSAAEEVDENESSLVLADIKLSRQILYNWLKTGASYHMTEGFPAVKILALISRWGL
jgi:hypothetical protein